MTSNLRVGIFDHMSADLGGGQLVTARMASQLSRECSVEIIHNGAGYSKDQLGAAFAVDLGSVSERIVPDVPESFSVPGPRSLLSYLTEGLRFDRALTSPYDIFVYSGHGVPPVCYARNGIIYCHFPFEEDPLAAEGRESLRRHRTALGRLARTVGYQWLWSRRFRGYRPLANSEFTASWVERLWKVVPSVVYPPVTPINPAIKRNLIVSIGRFDRRDRKQFKAQVRSFRNFLGRVNEDWTLRVLGFCRDSSEDREQVEELHKFARDLPITFVVNADRETIVSSLGEAKLFWNTRGLAEEGAEALPPRLMEHFGIATVEAMSAGCVPCAPANGGQVEIIEHGISGILCADERALAEESSRLARTQRVWVEMSHRARERSSAFRPAMFDERISEVVHELAAPRRRE
jgi:glycosyltransferase involved in cell wall biosynthesis